MLRVVFKVQYSSRVYSWVCCWNKASRLIRCSYSRRTRLCCWDNQEGHHRSDSLGHTYPQFLDTVSHQQNRLKVQEKYTSNIKCHIEVYRYNTLFAHLTSLGSVIPTSTAFSHIRLWSLVTSANKPINPPSPPYQLCRGYFIPSVHTICTGVYY